MLGWTVQGPLAVGANVTHCANVIVLRACVGANEVSKVLDRSSQVEGIGVKCKDKQSSDTELVLTQFEKTLPKMDERHDIALLRRAVVYPADHLGVTKMGLQNLTNHRSKDAKLTKNSEETILTYLDERTTEVQRAEPYFVGVEEDHFDVDANCISNKHPFSHTPIEKLRLFVDGNDQKVTTHMEHSSPNLYRRTRNFQQL